MANSFRVLPDLLLGPMIRRAEQHQVCIQLVTSKACDISVQIQGYECQTQQTMLQLGEHCYLYVLVVAPSNNVFAQDSALAYQVCLNGNAIDLAEYGYEASGPKLVVPHVLHQVLHGSCRNPHYPSKDALDAADKHLSSKRKVGELGPSLLLMSGDQIYADDVSGPLILAIEQLTQVLGLYTEPKHNALGLSDSVSEHLYQRASSLPRTPWQQRSKRSLGYWLRQDEEHITSAHPDNHLIYLEEFIGYYLLTHSAVCWQLIDTEKLTYDGDNAKCKTLFDKQWQALTCFIETLGAAQRLFANVSTLTMFDDHDVTDDWNLTAQWEENIWSNAASLRIICNGLWAYWLFQGLGNDALKYSSNLLNHFSAALQSKQWQLSKADDALQHFGQWHYCLDTSPKLVVLDTRTHRWRNEQNFNEPSGLMDWEMLMQLQAELQHQQEVILVSPAPVFGVKAIEAVQSLFNTCGHPLAVDVENWMAHEGAARKLMDIFRRADTPKETIILSGDVHYSFCYSVQARFGKHDNRIWQLTASGIKNEFPHPLLKYFDYIDIGLYGKWSPLNFFTKRWQMEVSKHKVRSEHKRSPYLLSHSAISLVTLKDGKLSTYELLHGDGTQSHFEID